MACSCRDCEHPLYFLCLRFHFFSSKICLNFFSVFFYFFFFFAVTPQYKSFNLHGYSSVFWFILFSAAVLNRFPVRDQYKCQARRCMNIGPCAHIYFVPLACHLFIFGFLYCFAFFPFFCYPSHRCNR